MKKQSSNWNIANQLTIIRMVLVPFFILFYYLKFNHHFVVATVIAFVASSTDFLDGYLARKYQLVTKLGQILDPLSDKILTISALILFVESGLIPAWCILIVIFREFTISAFRMMASSKGIIIPASWLGKAKTFVQLVGILTLLVELSLNAVPYTDKFPLTAGQILIYISVVLALLSFIQYLVKNTGALFANEGEKINPPHSDNSSNKSSKEEADS